MEDKIFNQIEQKFKELVFEIQMQDNKKIIEFQDKLKALKEKLTLEEQIKKKDEYINILEDSIKGYIMLNGANEILIESYENLIEGYEDLIESYEKLNESNEKINEQNEEIIKTQRETINLYKCDN